MIVKDNSMQSIQKQFIPFTPTSGRISPFSTLSGGVKDIRRIVSICFFLRLNPFLPRNRSLFRFLAGLEPA
jgi:hypothetical protein